MWLTWSGCSLCSGNHCWHCVPNHSCSTLYKGSRNPVLKIMKWKLLGPFLTRHSSLCNKRKEIQRCKARRSCRPLSVVPQFDSFVRKLFLQSVANCHSLMAGGTIPKEPYSANGTLALESNLPCKAWITLKKWTTFSFYSYTSHRILNIN